MFCLPRCNINAAGRFRRGIFLLLSLAGGIALSSCSSTPVPSRELRVSVMDQKMALFENGQPVRVYGVSTSKYGLGDQPSSGRTPVGKMRIAKKIGHGLPPGMVFKRRRPTGEILPPNAPGRDPIVSRILWLQGQEADTRNAFSRYIYIHGTPEEKNIGRPASFGCIRMRSMDVIDLFNRVPEGVPVLIENKRLPGNARKQPEYAYTPPAPPVSPLKQHQPIAPRVSPATQLASTPPSPAKTRKSKS